MKVHIVVTDSDGNTFEGDATLVAASTRPKPAGHTRKATRRPEPTKLNFSLPPRAFAKRYGKTLRGPQKFTILVAKMADGKTGVAVNVKDIEKTWNQMKGSLGKYNSAYPTRARDSGWIDSPKVGSYVLLAGWDEVLRGQ